jgi:hypothetical protein
MCPTQSYAWLLDFHFAVQGYTEGRDSHSHPGPSHLWEKRHKAKYKARDFRSEGGDKGFDVDIGSSGKGWYIGRSHLILGMWWRTIGTVQFLTESQVRLNTGVGPSSYQVRVS